MQSSRSHGSRYLFQFLWKQMVSNLACHILGTDRGRGLQLPWILSMAPAYHFMLDTIPIDIDGPSNFNMLTGLFHQFVLAMTLGVLYHLIPLQKVLDLPSTDGVQIYLPLYKTMRSQQNRWDESFLMPFELIDRSYHEPPQQLSLRVNLSLSKNNTVWAINLQVSPPETQRSLLSNGSSPETKCIVHPLTWNFCISSWNTRKTNSFININI